MIRSLFKIRLEEIWLWNLYENKNIKLKIKSVNNNFMSVNLQKETSFTYSNGTHTHTLELLTKVLIFAAYFTFVWIIKTNQKTSKCHLTLIFFHVCVCLSHEMRLKHNIFWCKKINGFTCSRPLCDFCKIVTIVK